MVYWYCLYRYFFIGKIGMLFLSDFQRERFNSEFYNFYWWRTRYQCSDTIQMHSGDWKWFCTSEILSFFLWLIHNNSPAHTQIHWFGKGQNIVFFYCFTFLIVFSVCWLLFFYVIWFIPGSNRVVNGIVFLLCFVVFFVCFVLFSKSIPHNHPWNRKQPFNGATHSLAICVFASKRYRHVINDRRTPKICVWHTGTESVIEREKESKCTLQCTIVLFSSNYYYYYPLFAFCYSVSAIDGVFDVVYICNCSSAALALADVYPKRL